MTKKILRGLGGLIWLAAAGAGAAPGQMQLSLADLTDQALKNSPKLESAKLSFLAAQSEAHSAGAAEYPRLSLSGNYFYDTTIPDLHLGPSSIPFGFNNNWSVDAALSFDLWDFRSQHNLANSAEAQAPIPRTRPTKPPKGSCFWRCGWPISRLRSTWNRSGYWGIR